MFPFRDVATRHAFAKVTPLLSSLFLFLLLSGVQSFAVEISVVSEEAEAVAPVANALVKLNDRIQYTDSQGLAHIDLKKGEKVTLNVTHPGYKRHIETIVGDGNPGASYRVKLEEIPLFNWTGTLLDEYSDTPVVGAEIRLEADQSNASIVSNYNVYSDWEGNFAVLGMTPGNYRLSFTKPGFDSIEKTIEVSPEHPAEAWKIRASVIRTSSIQIKVVDSTTGAGIPKANIRLEEGYGVGLVDEKTTAANGVAQFENVKIGVHNRSNGEKLNVTVAKLVVSIAAENYYPSVFAVDAGEKYTFKLDPVQTIEEQEPNGEFTSAQVIPVNAVIEHKISEKGEMDIFRFELENDAHVTFKGNGPL